MALLSESSSYDLVIMAHRGFENVVTMWDLFRGSLIGKTIDVMITKYPFTDIPKSETERRKPFSWMYGRELMILLLEIRMQVKKGISPERGVHILIKQKVAQGISNKGQAGMSLSF